MTEFVLDKRCSECGEIKAAGKFYKHPDEPDGLMRHCKACHNGCTEMIARVRAENLERQWGDPTEEQIAEKCEIIRSGWSPKECQKRKAMKWLVRRLEAAR